MKIAKEQLGFRFGNEEIKNSIATADNRTVLYHNTNLESLMYILKDGNLKFNRMDMLNDVQESDFFKNDEIAKLVFVSCFSYADESIPMWHMYSSKNEGVRIGFKVSDRQCHLVNQFQIKIQWFSFRESHCFFSSKT